MNRVMKIVLPLLISVVFVAGILLGDLLNFQDNSFSNSSNKRQKLNRLINFIDKEYVDDVNTDSIVDITVTSILKNLDPHSAYISNQDYDFVQDNMRGDFVGIGISFYTIKDTIAVIRTLEKGPGEKAGLEAGDRILYADAVPLFGNNMSNDSLTKILKGPANSKVNLKVKRLGENDLLDFEINRGVVPLTSVDAGYMVNDTLGYIKINRFAESTYTEFKTKMKQFATPEMKSVILDLRGNGGGFLKQATLILDEFIQDDRLLLFTKNKNGDLKETFSSERGDYEDQNLYVFIDEKSASASEIVAGAIQDNDRGTIIGRRSFGKGLVQREMNLGDGSAVRLTVARYYTPTGRSIQRPYENGNSEAYYSKYMERYSNGELLSKDSITIDDSLRYETPEGKVVYGGGGIIPDIFVPRDSDQAIQDIKFMYDGGVMDRFIFDLLDENRKFYNSLSQEEFLERTLITDKVLDRYTRYLGDYNMNYNFGSTSYILEKYLKATMARQLFGSDLAEKISNENDVYISRLLKLNSAESTTTD
ncbi:S41 family peptidase [Psychroflexus montanilacus]|uniref:S41 family peptidase n=1 Tax=Psychroflexus montanilacus TaxID=2873598 RepID=UPI001CC8F9D8|nr:S41 family peptidase [Psychroflexus montanilacus]MBZ9652762.1 S41 family peptidase [Psychroflexus montanilacus]